MSSKAWKVGNNIDTDLIIAARYLNDASDENMRAHCMEDVIPDYANTIAPGDVLVAGSNFGCGSSREHAPIAIKVAGTKCVIAESFARIFYRNAINIGLPIIESPEAVRAIDQGDELDVDLENGVITNLTKNETYHFEKFPEFIQHIVEAGNLLNYVKAKVGQ
ncbi:MAG: 3-isopropylmalate dehydratase small subunit [Peptococcaceae bacterium]|jgi:3-isopropylmalate/(R)-2-methylmalate dehydratase small subunit|nr:3-isopropylmalate dehydratase small subunit [Peptococcaceae bacterium]MEE0207080.1 3-isopropylmalate dehydratase small subunit [Peptococcaceae bacterium]